MNFKNECDGFLDKIVEMRNALTQQKVTEAIANEHIPFVTKMNAEKQRKIEEAKADLERNIAALTAAYQAKVAQYEQDTTTVIEAHRVQVIAAVESSLRPKFDNFILETSKLVDASGIV